MQKTMSREKMIKIYEEKIKQIFDNTIEYNTDHEKAIADVKMWLNLEWICGDIEDMFLYGDLLDRVDTIANKIIQNL